MLKCIIVDCVWGTWGTWTTCSKSCGSGVQVRTKDVDTHEENGGTACSGSSIEQQNCETAVCPAGNVSVFDIDKFKRPLYFVSTFLTQEQIFIQFSNFNQSTVFGGRGIHGQLVVLAAEGEHSFVQEL